MLLSHSACVCNIRCIFVILGGLSSHSVSVAKKAALGELEAEEHHDETVKF